MAAFEINIAVRVILNETEGGNIFKLVCDQFIYTEGH